VVLTAAALRKTLAMQCYSTYDLRGKTRNEVRGKSRCKSTKTMSKKGQRRMEKKAMEGHIALQYHGGKSVL
jgi:hypothetical protein